MGRIRTLNHLQNALDSEMSWRVKEIAALKFAADGNQKQQKVYLRAGLALLYAHWEGFIRAASMAYLEFVGNRQLSYRELKTCFCVVGLKGQLETLQQAKKPGPAIAAFDFVRCGLDNPARLDPSTSIETRSNLTSKVFTGIAKSLAIEISDYETKFKLIDHSLVRGRNKVAHGEYLDLGSHDFRVLSDEIFQLMRNYKTDLENAASSESYKR